MYSIVQKCEMHEFRSLSTRTFEENSPENLSVFSQCLEGYFFKTKGRKFAAFSRPERKFLTGKITLLAVTKNSSAVRRPVPSHQCTVYL